MPDGGGQAWTIRRAAFMEAYRAVYPLLAEHWGEVAKFKDLMVLNPDIKRYVEAELAGQLVVLVAEVDGQAVGYSANFLLTNLHYADLVYCQNDVLFVALSHREGRLGLALIHETERAAREAGAKMMLWHSKPGTALEKLMPRLLYEVLDTIHAKRL